MTPTALLDFWFGTTREDPSALPERMRFWFGGGPDTAEDIAGRDAVLRARFSGLMAEREGGGLEGWSATAAGRLALILLADQLPRNVHRGSARAYASDSAARALCVEGLALGHDLQLRPLERVFFYLPLEHAESLADQDRCVALFESLERDAPAGLEAAFAGFTRFARWHRDIVARFGRFPHRNRVLGRPDTPDEAGYLAAGAPGFGQA